MKTSTASKNLASGNLLICSNCGNTHRFIEVMAEEVHIVDGNLNYIRLLEAVTDHYICCQCDESLPANLSRTKNRP